MDNNSEMKGFLTFLVLWMISRKPMTGAEISQEITKRRGHKPSPGTIYPCLKDLTNKGLVTANKSKSYKITKKGQKQLDAGLKTFFSLFCDLDEMKSCSR